MIRRPSAVAGPAEATVLLPATRAVGPGSAGRTASIDRGLGRHYVRTLFGDVAKVPNLLITADDRTGALEVGGACADEGFAVTAGAARAAESATDCAVVDTDSRHADPGSAARSALVAHDREAGSRCHKIDSVLRGNWPFEVRALLDTGLPVAVVASYPDAGRRCTDGVVYVHDVPVAESAFGRDRLNPLTSSRPADLLAAAGVTGDVEVWDASNNAELAHAAERARAEGRMLAGPSGAVAAFARTFGREPHTPDVTLERPVLVVCGSVNAVSRAQIAALDCPTFTPGEPLTMSEEVTVLATRLPPGGVEPDAARSTASGLAQAVAELGHWRTLIVLGGDTAAAIIGPAELEVLGSLATAVPVMRFRDRALVTKGGGIGDAGTLVKLLGG